MKRAVFIVKLVEFMATISEEEIQFLQIQVRHLNNELALTQQEYEKSTERYFEIHSNLESIVAEKTGELEQLRDMLQIKNEELEIRVVSRTAELVRANEELVLEVEERKLAEKKLRTTLDHLVETEKMAALGNLVAGIAHEINTPVGIGVTAASFLNSKVLQFRKSYSDGKMSREGLNEFLNTAGESTAMILSNLSRAAEQVRSFKRVAVDQSFDEQRNFNVADYLDKILLSLKPEFKNTQHIISIHCSGELIMNSFPGALSQIFANLVMNSLIHGFAKDKSSKIVIKAYRVADKVCFYYRDTGKGIAKDTISKIFDPFFTTRRGEGGSGLGLHIVYNLVTQKLLGSIRVVSEPGKGLAFVVRVPITVSGD